MGYYKDTGSLRSMASAEAILKKRMPEKVGILPVAELLFVAESMWVGEHDMKGYFHPSFRFVKAKRYNAKPHVLIELDGETLADINGRSKYYEGFSRCVDRKPEEGAWIEPTEFGMMFLSILDLGMSEEEAEKNRNPDYPNMETDIQKSLLTSPPFDGVWNGAAQDGRREKGKKRMGAFPGASRPVPRLQEGCPCCVQERNVFFRSRCLRPVCKAQRSGDHRASI